MHCPYFVCFQGEHPINKSLRTHDGDAHLAGGEGGRKRHSHGTRNPWATAVIPSGRTILFLNLSKFMG